MFKSYASLFSFSFRFSYLMKYLSTGDDYCCGNDDSKCGRAIANVEVFLSISSNTLASLGFCSCHQLYYLLSYPSVWEL